jgi:hypothetical protein
MLNVHAIPPALAQAAPVQPVNDAPVFGTAIRLIAVS